MAAWIRTVEKGNIWQKAANTVELKDIDGKSRVAATVDDIMLTFDFNIMTARAGLCGTRSDKPKVQHRNHHHRHHYRAYRAPPATACYFGVLRACCAIVQI